MRKLMRSISSLARPVMLALALWGVLFAQDKGDPSKEDKKFWQKKASSFVKNPENLQGEVISFKDSIKYWKQVNKEIEMTGKDADLWREIDSLQQRIIKLENELRSLIMENSDMEGARKSVQLVNDLGIKTGLVYRVMFNDPDKQAEAARNFNKFVVGGFRTEQEAENFQLTMKAIGLKGETTIVPYIDGVKVESTEVEAYKRQRGE